MILLLPFIFFKKTCIKIKCEISNKTILECSHEFPMTDLLRVTLVSVKESWGIRISLNIMRSTQVFNEILYENSYFYRKKMFNKNAKKMNFDKIDL